MAFQGLTIAALLWGSMEVKKMRDAEAVAGVEHNQSVLEEARLAKEKERRGFEERLREAERITEEEERVLGRSKGQVSTPGGVADDKADNTKSSKSSWLWK